MDAPATQSNPFDEGNPLLATTTTKLTLHSHLLNLPTGNVFVRHTGIEQQRETLLCIHGLGESGLCFRELLDDPRFADLNVIVPDLPGYGCSIARPNVRASLNKHADTLWKIVDTFELGCLSVVGHSMGGDIGSLLCSSDNHARIERFVNVEGNLTRPDLFISSEASTAASDERFEKWFQDEFRERMVLQNWGKCRDSARRYYASLRLASLDVFQRNAEEMNASGVNGGGCEFGERFKKLKGLDKVFCYGTESLSKESVDFLEENQIPNKPFTGAGHWVMIDKSVEFYSFLREFLQ